MEVALFVSMMMMIANETQDSDCFSFDTKKDEEIYWPNTSYDIAQ